MENQAMTTGTSEVQHAALWLIGPDMPGLLRLGAKFVADRGGNIDKDIADKFGEKAVVFMSITAKPADIKRMEQDKDVLKTASGCGVVFQPMKQPTVPEGYQGTLHGFDIVTNDSPGLVAEITGLLADFGVLVVGHTGERRIVPGPRSQVQAGQKYVVMLPHDFDHLGFTRGLDALAKRYNGALKSPLRAVPGLLWWW
jgi:glycine cleavage system regulatory protein